MRRSSGPTPAIGLMAPPSTWYLPRNSRVRSIATTSLGSSTTQMVTGERRGSRQMRHCGSCATLPQISQNRTRSFTSVSASDSRRHVRRIRREEVERDALGALGTDSGQSPELVDQVLDRAFVHARQPTGSVASRRRTRPAPPRTPGRPRGRPRSAADRPRTGAGRRTAATSRAPERRDERVHARSREPPQSARWLSPGRRRSCGADATSGPDSRTTYGPAPARPAARRRATGRGPRSPAGSAASPSSAPRRSRSATQISRWCRSPGGPVTTSRRPAARR